MKKYFLMLALIFLLVLAACGGDDSSSDDTGGTDEGTTEEPANDEGETATASGEEIFQANCASCHGADLSGGAGPDLTAVGSSYSQEEIADIIQNGKGSMPAQAVSGEDLDTLTSWLAEQK